MTNNSSATKLTSKKIDKFLLALADTGNVTKSCKMADTSKDSIYKRRHKNDEFAAAWDRAVSVAADQLEEEAWRRACEGYDVPLHHQGRLTGDEMKKYSDILLIFLLKGNKPEKFKDRVDHSGKVSHGEIRIFLPDNGRGGEE